VTSGAIVVHEVRKTYGRVHALSGVNLVIPAGTVLGLLGPNGAGKSTLVRICTTLLHPDSGEVRVAGFDVVRQSAAVRGVIGTAGQSASLDEELTGRENLVMLARLYGLSFGRGGLHRRGTRHGPSRVAELLDRFDLTAVADRRAGTYSGGMRRRLDLASAFVADPQVVFLDEPTVGLDPGSRLELWDLIAKVSAAGVTVLLATQYLEEAEQLADRIMVMDRGQILVEDTIDALKNRYGEPRLDVVVRRPEQVPPAADRLGWMCGGTVEVDLRLRRLVIPLPGGAGRIGSVVDALVAAGIEIDDVALRRPTLDEVFLTITGGGPVGSGTAAGWQR